MRAAASISLLALVALLAGPALRAEVFLFAPLAVAVGVALSLLVAGRLSPEPVALGSIGAVAATALAPEAPVLAGGVGLALVFASRALRARRPREAVLQVAVALVAGAAATWIAARYAQAPFGVELAAALVAALVAFAPALLPVDDPLAADLRRLARRCRDGSTRARLVEAAELRRRMAPSVSELPRAEALRLEGAFAAIVRLAARLVDTPAERELDRRLGRLLAVLSRADRAARQRSVLEGGGEGRALAELGQVVDGIEAEADALAEVEPYRATEAVRQWPR